MANESKGVEPVLELGGPPGAGYSLVADAFGISAGQTLLAFQTDSWKELVNKLSWAIGSTYRIQYGSVNNPSRKYALRIARRILMDHGYPSKIAANSMVMPEAGDCFS